MKLVVIVCVVAFVVLVLLAMSMVHVITPREMTMTAIGETFYRVHLYAKSQNKLPTTFDELPRRENRANRTTDGWGNELIYSIDDSGIVTLGSLGADEKLGGTRSNADLSRSYKWLDDAGNFIASDDLWLGSAQLHAAD